MRIIVTLGDKKVSLTDLPGREYAPIVRKYDTHWYAFCNNPVQHWEAMEDVLEAIAKHVGEASPLPMTKAKVETMFSVEDDDLPDYYIDGLPAPKVDEQTIEPSSGS